MFTQIERPSIVIYDGETNKLIGGAKFILTPKSKQTLLDLVNGGIKPSALILLNENIYQPAYDYVPPIPNKKYRRMGFIHAIYTDSFTRKQIPVIIQMKYNAIIRGDLSKNPYLYDSVEYSNIESTNLIY